MRFSELAGHEKVVTLLKQNILQDTLSHAYLFHGPAHVGKTMAAACFAATLNCKKTVSLMESRGKVKKENDFSKEIYLDACGECSPCLRMKKNAFPDVREIIPEKKFIRIPQIREMNEKVYLRPLEGPWKVFMISEAEKMTQEAASAILKTLEEPPDFTIFVLLSSQPSLLFPTLISRCQKISFERPSESIVERLLEKKRPAENVQLKLIARLCCGQIGTALKLGQKLVSARDGLLSLLLRLTDEPSYIVPRLAEDFVALSDEFEEDEKENLFFACDMLLLIVRDILLMQLSSKPLVVSRDKLGTFEELSSRFTVQALLSALDLLHILKQDLWSNAQVLLGLQSTFFKLKDLKSS